jgi:rRNA processing protein Krr1/Pno1
MIEIKITIDEARRKLNIEKMKEYTPTAGDRYAADMFLALAKGLGEGNPLKYFSQAPGADVLKLYGKVQEKDSRNE